MEKSIDIIKRLRKPLPGQTEQTFKDKSKYHRPEKRQELKKIIKDVSEELKISNTEETMNGNAIRAAIDLMAYQTGDRSIMRKLYYKQHGSPDPSEAFTGGFGEVKEWQKQKQKGIKKPVSKPDGDGFDIMKQVVKHPTPINK
jgi:hypothetical protein